MSEPNGLSFWTKYLLPVLIGATSGILTAIVTVTIGIMGFKNTVMNQLAVVNVKLDERTERIKKLETDMIFKADKGTVDLLKEIATINSASIIGLKKDMEYVKLNSDIVLRKLDNIQDKVK